MSSDPSAVAAAMLLPVAWLIEFKLDNVKISFSSGTKDAFKLIEISKHVWDQSLFVL